MYMPIQNGHPVDVIKNVDSHFLTFRRNQLFSFRVLILYIVLSIKLMPASKFGLFLENFEFLVCCSFLFLVQATSLVYVDIRSNRRCRLAVWVSLGVWWTRWVHRNSRGKFSIIIIIENCLSIERSRNANFLEGIQNGKVNEKSSERVERIQW